MEIRELTKEEYGMALSLSWEVFMRFEAADYTQQGTESFYKAIHDEKYIEQLRIYGAFENGELAGIIAARSGGRHIALFFVKESFQRCGVGRELFLRCAQDNPSQIMTVNSSPYAVEVYHRLGFVDTAPEQTEDGIRYTPMQCILRNPDCPCKRAKCVRHGSCTACREHHRAKKNCAPSCKRENWRGRRGRIL